MANDSEFTNVLSDTDAEQILNELSSTISSEVQPDAQLIINASNQLLQKYKYFQVWLENYNTFNRGLRGKDQYRTISKESFIKNMGTITAKKGISEEQYIAQANKFEEMQLALKNKNKNSSNLTARELYKNFYQDVLEYWNLINLYIGQTVKATITYTSNSGNSAEVFEISNEFLKNHFNINRKTGKLSLSVSALTEEAAKPNSGVKQISLSSSKNRKDSSDDELVWLVDAYKAVTARGAYSREHIKKQGVMLILWKMNSIWNRMKVLNYGDINEAFGSYYYYLQQANNRLNWFKGADKDDHEPDIETFMLGPESRSTGGGTSRDIDSFKVNQQLLVGVLGVDTVSGFLNADTQLGDQMISLKSKNASLMEPGNAIRVAQQIVAKGMPTAQEIKSILVGERNLEKDEGYVRYNKALSSAKNSGGAYNIMDGMKKGASSISEEEVDRMLNNFAKASKDNPYLTINRH